MTNTTKTLLDIIPYGKENKITSSEISRRTGLSGAEIRKYVHQLRENNEPIASDSKGYWIATEECDIDKTISSLNSRIHEMIVVRESLKNSKRNIGVNVCG